MKIVFVSESGIYDHWREVFKKHTKLLAKAVSVETSDLIKARLDDSDVIVYFDDSSNRNHSFIEINIQMINHSAMMSGKGIKTLIVTKKYNLDAVMVYMIFNTVNVLTEIGEIGEASYAYHTYEILPIKPGKPGFRSMNWTEFERRFIL